MEIKEFAVKLVRRYFMLVTFITVAMMILGGLFDSSAGFGYEAFASPLIYALCGVLPGVVMYSKRELSVRQTIVRKIVQLLMIEAEITVLAMTSPNAPESKPAVVAALAASVLIIFVAVNITELLMDMNTAVKLNSGLGRLREQEE